MWDQNICDLVHILAKNITLTQTYELLSQAIGFNLEF